MKIFCLLLGIVYSLNMFSQDSSSNLKKFNEIKTVQYEVKEMAEGPIYEDTAVNYFLKQGASVLPFLIEKIADTTFSKVERKAVNSFYRKGDLAIILLSNIEPIPFAYLTHMQWCICCEHAFIPEGFFSYLDRNRLAFQLAYKIYCIEQERKRNSKQRKATKLVTK